MASTFHYHIVKTSWGIAVLLTCQAHICNEDVSKYVAINDRLHLDILQLSTNMRLSDEEIGYLRLGLGLVANQIGEATPDKCVLITVLRVDLDATDYQPEGLAWAITGWAAEYFRFNPPAIPTSYDRQRNRYDFQFP